MRDQGEIVNIFRNVFTENYLSHLLSTLDYITNRFQHIDNIGNIALILEKQNIFYSAYLQGDITPYWQDGMLQNIVKKLLGIASSQQTTLNSFSFNLLFFEPIGYTRNIHVGIASWFIVLYDNFFGFIFYMFLVVLAPGLFLAKYTDIKVISILMTGVLLFLLHGWLASYIDLVTYLLIFVTMRKVRITFKTYSKTQEMPYA